MNEETNAPASTPNMPEDTGLLVGSTNALSAPARPPITLTKAELEALRSMPFELRVRELAFLEYDRRQVYDRIRSAQRRKDFQEGWNACMFLHNVPPLQEPPREEVEDASQD